MQRVGQNVRSGFSEKPERTFWPTQYLCAYVSIYVPMCRSMYLCVYVSMYLSICLSIYISIYLSLYIRITLLYTWNQHDIVHPLYFNKKNFKNPGVMWAELNFAVTGPHVGTDWLRPSVKQGQLASAAHSSQALLPFFFQIQPHPSPPEWDTEPNNTEDTGGRKRHPNPQALALCNNKPSLEIKKAVSFFLPGVFQLPQGNIYCFVPRQHLLQV